MRQSYMFGSGRFGPALMGRQVPLRSRLGQPADPPPTCGPNEKLTIKMVGLEQKWACESIAGGAPAPVAPVGVVSTPACTAPEGYGPLPTGGAAVDRAVYACPMPDGTFDVINVRSFAPVLQGVSRACLDTFGDVTMMTVDDAVCKGTPQAAPTNDACRLPADEKFVMCPPSNGITENYYLYANTSKYAPDMTTQPSECMNAPNVTKVGVNSPYCGGSEVQGPGSGPPQLVACFKQLGATSWEEGLVDVHNGPDFSLLASGVMIKDIETRFPGKRYIIITDMFCSALPDFGLPAVPAPAAAPEPCPGVPEMPFQEWQDLVLKQKIDWENGGKKTLVGGPVKWTAPDGKTATSQYCYWPDGTSAEVPTNFSNGCPISCQEIYDKQHAAPPGGAPAPVAPVAPVAPGTPIPVAPSPVPPSGAPVIVYIPPPSANPSPCDAGAWLRRRPVVLGQVRLRRGTF